MRQAIFFVLMITALPALANLRTDAPTPISHCYHWLKSQYLTPKLDYAQKNDNELTFFTTSGTSNGAMAGPGLYCAKSPSQSYSYGDRLIRVDFVDDVVFQQYDRSRVCGHRGDVMPASECAGKPVDVHHYYTSPDYYVIRNMNAVARWSVADQQLIDDLRAEIPVANDSSYKYKAEQVIALIQAEMTAKGTVAFLNGRARMSLADLWAKEPDRIKTLPPAGVLSALAGIPAGKIPADVMEKLAQEAVNRMFESPQTKWTDARIPFEKGGPVRKQMIDIVNNTLPLKPGNPPPKNWGVVIGVVANSVAGEMSAGVGEAAAAYLMLDLSSPLWNEVKPTLYSPLRPALVSQIGEWMNATRKVGDSIRMYKAVATMDLDYGLKDRLSRSVKSNFPPMDPNGINVFYRTTTNYFSLGKDPKDVVEICQANIEFGDMYGYELYLGWDGRGVVNMGSASKTSDLKKQCEQIVDVAGQAMALKAKGATKIRIVKGAMNYNSVAWPFTFAIDDADALESLKAAAAAFLQRNSAINKVQEITAGIDGNSGSRSQYRGGNYGWTPAEVPLAMVGLAKWLGIRTAAEIAQERATSNSSKEYKIELQLTGRMGLMNKVYFATDSSDELERDCLATKGIYDFDGVDQVYYYYSVDGSGRMNSRASVSGGIDEVCAAVSKGLQGTLQDSATRAKFRTLDKYEYRFTAKLEGGRTLAIGGDHTEQVRSSCLTELKGVKITPFEYMTVRNHRGSNFSIEKEKGKYTAAGEICGAIVDRVSEFVPSTAQENIKKRKGKYTINATFGRQGVTFVVNNKQELSSQCQTLVRDQRTDDIRWSGDLDGQAYKDDNYWTTKAQLCSAFLAKVKMK